MFMQLFVAAVLAACASSYDIEYVGKDHRKCVYDYVDVRINVCTPSSYIYNIYNEIQYLINSKYSSD